VITSTPYWGLRMYEDSVMVTWADGELCAYGHEQTPEGFIRHTTEILHLLRPALKQDGSVWWNLMDSYNTRTQIRGNAVEALRAMQGLDGRKWHDHEARRYSAGHSYLKDGEQCMIPSRVAERASRIGYHVKSIITWAKQSSLPEPQNSRVSRGLEYVIHLSPTRTPKFDKGAYRRVATALGGRAVGYEPDKLSDVWVLPTSTGGGHGAQFPVSLPGRCIALSTDPGDVVLDPFVGSGNSGVAARALGRKFVGVDVSAQYLATADEKIGAVKGSGFEAAGEEAQRSERPSQALPMTGIV
jgi:DNA modification methylase